MRPGTLLRYYACRNELERLIRSKDVVLDVGGYDGFILLKLKEKKEFVPIILDLNKEALKIAKKKGLKIILASGTKIPLKKNSVDVLLLLDVLEHVRKDNLLIKEVKRVLKKNGILILTTPIKNRRLVPFINMKKLHKSWGHVREGYTLSNIKNLLGSDFIILKSTTFFNLISRYAYFLLFYLNLPLSNKLKIFIYNLIIKTEKITKFGGMEYFIVFKYVPK